MLRAVLAMIACISLSACSGWVSDERLFGSGDWAHLDLNGPYDHVTVADDKTRRVILRTRPDGMIESTGPGAGDQSLMGLVPIKGGSGEFFLMVDRSDASKKGDEYFVARLSDGNGLALFLPNCRGTSPVDGMEKVRGQWPADEEAAPEEETVQPVGDVPEPAIDKAAEPPDDANASEVCKFKTREALMSAGLEAERFLSTPHVVAVFPLATLEPADDEVPE